jgi:hypothetical protein
MGHRISKIARKIINKLKHIRKTYVFRSAGVEQAEQIFGLLSFSAIINP